MDFEKALETLEIGNRVQVSTGEKEPTDTHSKKVWRTNNFEGTVVEMSPSGIQVELDPLKGATVAFIIEPGRGHTFFNLTPGLEELKERRIAELKKIRDEQEFGVITTPQGALQIDETSQGRIHRTTELGRTFEAANGKPFTTRWRMNDNKMVRIDLNVLTEWSILIGQHIQNAFDKYATLYTAIQAATTEKELDAVDIKTGWSLP